MACISLPTATLIAGGLGAVGGVASAVIGSNAATQAAKLQSDAAAAANKNTQQMFSTTQANLEPYMAQGVGAIPELQGLLGLKGSGSGPNGGAPDAATIQKTLEGMPGYQFQLQQGLQATQSGFAAQGLGQSGAALKGAANYAEGLAGTSYQQLFGNVLNSVGLGESAAGTLGQQGLGYANAENSLTTGGAAASAAGVVGSANSTIGGINNAIGGVNNALITPAMFQLLLANGGLGAGGAAAGGTPDLFGGPA